MPGDISEMWTEVGRVPSHASPLGFRNGVAILVNKPHVINRRLCGAKILAQWHTSMDGDLLLRDILKLGAGCNSEEIVSAVSRVSKVCTAGDDSHDVSAQVKVTVRELLPKQLQRFSVLTEVIVIDMERSTATFVPLLSSGGSGPQSDSTSSEPSLPMAYRLQMMTEGEILTVSVSTQSPPSPPQSLGCSPEWLRSTLLPRLARWCEEPKLNIAVTSLRLVPVDKYNDRYQDMKARYGRRLVETWPEGTDPRKFVYEDVAIAAYLLVLWEEERREKGTTDKQSFVDLGCGNGLLVHLLNSEGHPGTGIDVRRRKIWDLYGPETSLLECAITPSDSDLFPECDWILGNHSDELTPWIPVIAARSSYECCFFVLPCCHWDFSGKFRYKEAGTSQYRTYLEFVRSVGETCGFRVQEDTMRIPSTKRVCFVGSQRTYTKETANEKCSEITAYIDARCRKKSDHSKHGHENGDTEHPEHHGDSATTSCGSPTTPCATPQKDTPVDSETGAGSRPKETIQGQNWAEDFQARSRIETSRNCVGVDKGITEMIVTKVFEQLLADEAAEVKALPDGRTWNAGGRIELSDIASWFDSPTLHHLKAECGGLQTLLRNKHQIFQVSGGCVCLRDWTRAIEHNQHQMSKKKRKGNNARSADPARVTKTQLCYFHEHHPNGCQLTPQACRFAHGPDELRPGPIDHKQESLYKDNDT